MATQEELRGYLKAAALELEKTRRRLNALEQRRNEPIAVVGMACRYPGGLNSPEDLWSAVAAGRDMASGLPTDRGWDRDNTPDSGVHGQGGLRVGGFVDGVTCFDTDFFHIDSAEALAMDPRQRMVLEPAWEAFERAGIDPSSVRGRDVGVYLGVMSNLGVVHHHSTAAEYPENIAPFLLTGNMPSVVAGRLSHFFGIEGPAVTLDTACSSSLVAIHEGVKSLRAGECSLVMAGGVTVIAAPTDLSGVLGQGHSAADGRCKSFAAQADGTGWGEGVGIVLLERLSDALKNGHPVRAVLRGSAVNHSGAANDLTTPSGLSQQSVIRQALANAGVDAAEVDVIEAHGTGTMLGDLIEAEALMATYGRKRPAEQPLWLGSIKSNITHTAAAAGVGGLIKMVEALSRGVIPPTLHVNEPAPYVDWQSGRIRLATETQPWPASDRPRRAGVSAFGMSGTNAHVIVEQAPEVVAAVDDSGDTRADNAGVVPWVVTARSARALQAQADRLVAHLERNPQARPLDIGLSLADTRAKFAHRAIIIGRGGDELRAGLRCLGADTASAAVMRGVAEGTGRTALLFAGEGTRRVGNQLYAQFPAYAAAFDEVCAHADEHLTIPLRDVWFAGGSDAAPPIERRDYAHFGLFALEVALFRLAQSFGLRPDFLTGCGLGEVAAAHAAGVWTLEDACSLVAQRGRLVESMHISVTHGAPVEVTAGFEGAARPQCFESALAEFGEVCRRVAYSPPRIDIVSAVTGRPIESDEVCSPEYWVEQFGADARLVDALFWARVEGRVENFLGIGPDSELTDLAKNRLAAAAGVSADIVATPLLQPGIDEGTSFVRGLATVYAQGASIDWVAAFAGSDARRVDLPTYAFQPQRCWLEPAARGDVLPVHAAPAPKAKVSGTGSAAQLHTATERALAAAIEQVLGATQVGSEDSFLALGGDSILSLKLAARLWSVSLPLTPQMIFEHPTVRQLAAALDVLVAGRDEKDGDTAVGAMVEKFNYQPMSLSGLSITELASLQASWPGSS
ncbi:type I polyketide synthase [Mycobacterium marinum]|uniref:type I polyketide synthase n=1 Tax=Mycobacterium marinum TaxID=1781 RepID=UPI0035643B88